MGAQATTRPVMHPVGSSAGPAQDAHAHNVRTRYVGIDGQSPPWMEPSVLGGRNVQIDQTSKKKKIIGLSTPLSLVPFAMRSKQPDTIYPHDARNNNIGSA